MHVLEHKFPPPLLMALIGIAMWVTTILSTVTGPVSNPWRLPLAVALALAGLAITMLGGAAFRAAMTTIDPVRIERASKLVSSGVYRYTRNPMYVGFTALLAAWAVWLAEPWTWLGPVAFAVFITRFQIVPEERVMREKFGAAYAAYCQRVRRWI